MHMHNHESSTGYQDKYVLFCLLKKLFLSVFPSGSSEVSKSLYSRIDLFWMLYQYLEWYIYIQRL